MCFLLIEMALLQRLLVPW